jgi:hypothetical protein
MVAGEFEERISCKPGDHVLNIGGSMTIIRRIAERACTILEKGNTFRLFTINTICTAIVLLFANTLFAQYSNSTLNGPWFLHSMPIELNDDSTNYLVFDGNGNITGASMFFGIVTGNYGTYSVTATGAISGTLMGTYPMLGQLTSQHDGYGGNMRMSKVTNPGALTDSLVGVISGNGNTLIITLHLNSNGVITSAVGLIPPVSGRVYADSGIFEGHLRTGAANSCWDEFSIVGTYVNDSLIGILFLDCKSSNGTVNLVRKGTISSIMKRSQPVSESQQIICRNNGAGMFSISTRNIITGNVQIKVMDLLGRNLVAEPITHAFGNYSAHVDLSKLSKGIYFIQLQSNKIIFQHKILIK